jgi:hypothetical protein
MIGGANGGGRKFPVDVGSVAVRIQAGFDFLSIPWKKRGLKAPLPWVHPVDLVPTLWIR